jgi:hypothetical protein
MARPIIDPARITPSPKVADGSSLHGRYFFRESAHGTGKRPRTLPRDFIQYPNHPEYGGYTVLVWDEDAGQYLSPAHEA